MFSVIIGFSILGLITLRPFAYKRASLTIPHSASAYLTALWCLLLGIGTLPFFWEYLFVDGTFVLLNPFAVFLVIRGIGLYYSSSLQQSLNKSNTSVSVFYGYISLALVTLLAALLFGEKLPTDKLIIILLIGTMGALFFIIGEGSKVSAKDKKNFVLVVLLSAGNTFCDYILIKYLNWYVDCLFPFAVMFVYAFAVNAKTVKIPFKSFVTTPYYIFAGVLWAVGGMLAVFAMQYVFSVIIGTFLVRVAQSLDIVLAHHIYKEGKLSLQYFFGLGSLVLGYLFFFGIPDCF